MQTVRHVAATLFLLAGMFAAPFSARAAESYDNCAGFIDTVPATISTQGVWCLRHDLSTAITSGDAITIATNNVTIDCNDFKLGGLAAGDGSLAFGIHAAARQNAVVRHCGIRGFYYGINLDGGAGHLVGDNRLDNNLFVAINVHGDNATVQRNRVYDTGGASGKVDAAGIDAQGHVLDNTVSGVFAVAADTYPARVKLSGQGSEARSNRIGGLDVSGEGFAIGMLVTGGGDILDGNRIVTADPLVTPGMGIQSSMITACMDNVVFGFSLAYSGCTVVSDNLSDSGP